MQNHINFDPLAQPQNYLEIGADVLLIALDITPANPLLPPSGTNNFPAGSAFRDG